MDSQIIFDKVGHEYNANTPFAVRALHDVNLDIPENKITAIVGHTGSGKSTLIQHLNLLLKPTSGTITIDKWQVSADSKAKNLKQLRKQVGVVFQFPEAQLFEETILKDVMFGPLNFDVPIEEAEAIAKEKLALVGIAPELFERSPFELSGGQMRRVAIAGVLALEPSVLVLDEPTAGLDPLGHKHMMEMFIRLQKEQGLTLVLVTHQMDDVVKYSDYVIVMEKGTVIKKGTPEDIFNDEKWLHNHQLGLPQSIAFIERLNRDLPGIKDQLNHMPLTVEELAQALVTLNKNMIERGDQNE